MDRNAWKYEIAKRLKQAMDDRRMSATELSQASGVGKSDISNYLAAKYKPKQDKIYLLASALGVDPAWLYAMDEAVPEIGMEEKAKPPDHVPVTSEARILSAGVDRMPEEDRKKLLQMVELMFDKYKDYFETGKEDD